MAVPLTTFGWNDRLDALFAPFAAQGLVPGRVAREHTHIYAVLTSSGECLARVTGRFRHAARGRHDFPAVGDWVALASPDADARARIQAVLPRSSKFSRKIAGQALEEQVVAANVDTIFVVSALDRDFNLRRLERYLVVGRESRARPVVILNKADLRADADAAAAEVHALADDLPVHVISCLRGEGLDALAPYLQPGRTVALLGSSGVGKSTIVNCLLGEDRQTTREVRADRRGRHTTTHRELIVVPGGALLIDTPGLRELQLWETDQSVRETFDDIETLAAGCFFRDCRHLDEPRCAVKAAVDDGRLAPGHLANYHKLRREQAALAARRDPRVAANVKRKWKAVSKAVRDHKPRQ